eukprot:m.16149 g.16149  ORF g.16149 m.16149 type:complete len:72 (+) comp10890_c0_seq1:192-407(+)
MQDKNYVDFQVSTIFYIKKKGKDGEEAKYNKQNKNRNNKHDNQKKQKQNDVDDHTASRTDTDKAHAQAQGQ